MAQVTIELNDKPYVIGCEDGQEEHLRALARLFDAQVRQVAKSVGQLGDTRLFLMAALIMADDLGEAHGQLSAARAELARAQGGRNGVEEKAIGALDAATRRIEALAARVGTNPA